ncbi:MAG: ATP-binding protein [Chloroflexi bacterium]|nr:ATP-binding protein [Chloroflexota bacterium]
MVFILRLANSVSLQTKIIVFVMLGLSVSFGLLSLFGLEAVNESTERALDERLIIARMAANQIDQTVKHGIEDLETRARPGLIDMEDPSLEGARKTLKDLYRESPVFTANAFLLDAKGTVLATEPSDPLVVGTNLSSLPHIAKTLETGRPSISSVVAAPGTRRPIVSLTVAIKNRAGKTTGVLGGAMDLTYPNINEIIQGMRPGQTGHTQIVDQRGIVIASTNPDYVLREWHHSELVPPPKGQDSFVVSNPFYQDGKKIQDDVVAYVALQNTSWGVAVEQDASEAFAAAHVLRDRIALFALVSFVSGLFFAWLVARSVIRPIKLLTAASQCVAAGDLTATVPVRGRDELGVLAKSFDTMTARLLESRAEIESWNKDLEARVEERTRELSCLYEISQALSSTHDVDRLVETVAGKIAPFFEQADSASLFLYDPKVDVLVARSSFGFDPALGYNARLKVGEGLPGKVFETGEPILLNSDHGEALRDLGGDGVKGKGLYSAICVPLLFKSKMLGSFIVYSFQPGHCFNEAQLKLLQALADRIAVAIENARLLAQAEHARALEEADKLKSEFISTVSHELRTPLASIKGYSTTLLRKDTAWDEATREEFLEIIDEESDKLRELIDNLLEASKVEAGVLNIFKQPILLNRIAQKAVAERQARAKKHEFVAEFPPKFPILEADPRRVEQILHNLLENAVKYSPDGGKVVVRGEIHGRSALIGVSDQGVGIPPEQLDRVFDRFYRVENPLTRRAGGSGLGLSIARALVEAHGGGIWAQSAPGKGSTFYFTLPLSDVGEVLDESVEPLDQAVKA